MKQDDCDQVNDFFRAAVQDWTPNAARDKARVLFVPVSFNAEVVRSCSAILSDVELRAANGFLTDDLKNHFIQRRAFRRFCAAVALGPSTTSLSKIVFEETDKRRPYLSSAPGLWFSFSSCGSGFLGAWSFTHSLGVDVEDRTQEVEAEELAKLYFSEAEAKLVDEADHITRVRTFFRLWSLKESALKSIGEGLPFGLDTFGFDLSPKLRISHAPTEYGGPTRFDSHLIERKTTCAALVTHLK